MDGAQLPAVQPVGREDTSVFAVCSLVFGVCVVALIVAAFFGGESSNLRVELGALLFSPLAIVFAIVGLVRSRRHRMRGRWMAVLGLILGLAPWILLIALVAWLIATCGDNCFVN